MIKNLVELFSNLTKQDKRKIIFLQILTIFMSFAEVLSIMAFGPFMTLITNPDIIHTNEYINGVYNYFNFENTKSFIIFSATTLLIILSFSTILHSFTIWKIAINSNVIGSYLASRIYQFYMKKNWMFHIKNNSSYLINNLSSECGRVVHGIIQPTLNSVAKIILSLSICITIFIYNLPVALFTSFILTFCYFFIFKIVKKNLANNGKIISVKNALRFKLMSEGFGGIKETILLGRQKLFSDRFYNSSFEQAMAIGKNQAINQLPRQFMEFVSYFLVVVISIFLISFIDKDFKLVLPLLAIYAVAGLKLLPAFQHIFNSAATIKGNMSAYESLKDHILESSLLIRNKDEKFIEENISEQLVPKKNIKFENIYFRYPSTEKYILKNLNFEIKANQTIGIVGPSGSGKTTVIDLLCGLLQPSEGKITVDSENIFENTKNIRKWQNSLGLVSQSIFLSDISIKENIAFGLPKEMINDKRINEVVKVSCLDEFTNSLENGIDTVIGERGVQISGGQRQRIGIARALYHNNEILLFDEATSSLDGITEKNIMKSIYELGKERTIIIVAHRISTVKKCDLVYYLDKGNVIEKGTYSELVNKNNLFKQLAESSN